MSKFHLHVRHAKIGKLSSNLEMHGEDNVPGFTIPVTCELDRESLDGIMGKGFSGRVFVDKSGEPAVGFTLVAPMQHTWTWDKIHADLIAEDGGPSVLEFEDCLVKNLTLEFRGGWMTEASFQLYVHPGLGEDNLALQRWQRQELGELVLSGGERRLKASDRQAALPLGGQGSGSSPGAGSQSGEATVGESAGGSVTPRQVGGETVQ